MAEYPSRKNECSGPGLPAIRPILYVRHLAVSYRSPAGAVHAVRDVSLQIDAGETLALVGETGSGKSTVALALLGLLALDAHTQSGEILFEDTSLMSLPKEAWRKLRGSRIGMVFQDTRNALNPVLTIGDHLIESLRSHQKLSRKEAVSSSLELLSQVGIAEPAYCMNRYSFELSGGQCQRALALCAHPCSEYIGIRRGCCREGDEFPRPCTNELP